MLPYNTFEMFDIFQAQMRYKITGDYPAPDFFGINERTGAIYISRDLRLDSLQLNSYTVSQLKVILMTNTVNCII